MCHLVVDYLWNRWFHCQFPHTEWKVVWSMIGSCQVGVISAVLSTGKLKSHLYCTVEWFRFLRTPQSLMTQCISLAAERRLQIFSLSYVFTTLLLVLGRRLYSRLDSVRWMTCLSCWPHRLECPNWKSNLSILVNQKTVVLRTFHYREPLIGWKILKFSHLQLINSCKNEFEWIFGPTNPKIYKNQSILTFENLEPVNVFSAD